MAIRRGALLAALGAHLTSAALAQEQGASVAVPRDEAGWQKQCLDKADHDDLEQDLRPTFMIECVAGAKLNGPPAAK